MSETRSLSKDATEVVGWVLGLAAIVAVFGGGIWLLRMAADWLNYEPTWQWWLGAYLIAGLIVASFASLAIFALAWWWSAERWGGICFVFGWLPASIIAVIAWPLLVFLWGPLVALWIMTS